MMEEWSIGVTLLQRLMVMPVFCSIPSFQYSTIPGTERSIAVRLAEAGKLFFGRP